MRSPTPKDLNQIRSLSLKLTAISKFIPKLAELMHPILEVRKALDATNGSGWTNEAKKAFQKIKRKLNKLKTLTIPKEGEPTVTRNRSMLHPNRKDSASTNRQRTTFRKHKVMVATDGPMEEMLKLFGKEGRLAKWAAKLRTYDILFFQKKEVEGPVMKRFCKQGEQMLIVPDVNEAETSELDAKLQAELTPTPRAWRLYLSRETIKEGSSVGMILINPDAKTCSYVIHLNFNAPKHIRDYEALLVALVASAGKGMKDLHVFIDS
ncbi:hypothetical protein Tco_1311933 [Tanacetum coccineum]